MPLGSLLATMPTRLNASNCEYDLAMNGSAPSPIQRFLQVSACAVIVLWGVRTASAVLGPLLLGLLLAYAVVPFPEWLIRRFKFGKTTAIALTAVGVVSLGLYVLFAVDFGAVRVAAKLPAYEQHLIILYERISVFMNAHGMDAPVLTVESVFTPERLRAITEIALPATAVIISNGLLITLVAFLFVMEMAGNIGDTQSPLAERLHYYASDARSYITITARSAGINALVNLAFLIVMGVDTPVVWCFLYFLLDFIPSVGYIIALVPPTLVTLLMYGWERALVVACGLLLTNLIVDNVVTPMFMKKAVNISVLEITLSLVFWTFLFGVMGAILAIPLTLALKKFIAKKSQDGELASAPSG
jgi:AI-2 transport protein TqsA